jgi:hypothetical protein
VKKKGKNSDMAHKQNETRSHQSRSVYAIGCIVRKRKTTVNRENMAGKDAKVARAG